MRQTKDVSAEFMKNDEYKAKVMPEHKTSNDI